MKNHIDTTLHINYLNKTIANVPYTKFLGLVVGNTLTWDNHIDQLISKLNPACYVIRAVNAMLSRKALRMLYFSYVHSIISYDIIFWGNTPNCIKIFRIQKKVLRIMTTSKKMDSCRGLFKTTKILPFYSQYRVIQKSVEHLKNSQQMDYATDHGNSYVDRERISPSFFKEKPAHIVALICH